MPSRSLSNSPDSRVRHKKHKRRGKSRDPQDERRRSRSPHSSQGTSHKHKSSRKHKHYESSDSEYTAPRIKVESREHGYEKADESNRRHRDENDRQSRQRPIKHERDDSESRNRRHDGRSRSDHNRPRDGYQQERQHNDDRRRRDKRNKHGGNPFQSDSTANMEYGMPETQNNAPPQEKEKPNFEVSGKLLEDTNVFKGVIIKYSEPAEAKKPRTRWRLYPFKGDEALKVMHIHRQSAYLLGRDRRIADIPIDHPSCSKQHAVLQYRLMDYTRADGSEGRQVRPYIIDLGSANGSYVNNKRIEAQRYVELIEKDVLKFGFSTREYVVLTDKASTDELNDSDEDEEDEDSNEGGEEEADNSEESD